LVEDNIGDPCPELGIATRIDYVFEQAKADELTTKVRHYFEAR